MDVGEAQKSFFELAKHGTVCPVCKRFGKFYSRPMRAGMVLGLIALYRFFKEQGPAWCHVESWLLAKAPQVRGGDWCKLRFWGFLEKRQDDEADDLMPLDEPVKNPKNGYWRITERGIQFIKRALSVPERVVLYNNELHGFEGEPVDILTVLSRGGFQYSEIMGDVA